ncbi:MAG: hypothetical protein ACHP7N_08470 [Caulobacterales bacterium]
MRNSGLAAALGGVIVLVLLLGGWEFLSAQRARTPTPAAALPTSQPAGAAPPATPTAAPSPDAGAVLAAIFRHETLGMPLSAFEAKYGAGQSVGERTADELRSYQIAGCQVSVEVDPQKLVSGLGLDLKPGCTFDPNSLLSTQNLASANTLTFGDLADAMPNAEFRADCLAPGCGQPPHYLTLLWRGGWTKDPAAFGVMAREEVRYFPIDDALAVDAAISIGGQIAAAKGPDYVRLHSYNCDADQFTPVALPAIRALKISYLGVGHDLDYYCQYPGR